MRPREISNFEFRISDFPPTPHRPGIPEQPGRVGPRVAEVYRGYNSRVVDENRHLPVIEDGLEDETPACSPTNYVSNEEAALLASMRRLREKSMVVRRDLKDADPEDRARLEAELAIVGNQLLEVATQPLQELEPLTTFFITAHSLGEYDTR